MGVGASRGLFRLSATDKFFAGLRLSAIVIGAAWLLVTPHLEHLRRLAGLVSALAVFTLLIYGVIYWTRWPLRHIYLAAQLVDLCFLFALVRWTGGVDSVFVLGFYLLVGLHSFYFGRRLGMLLASGAAALLVLSDLGVFRAEPWPDSIMRLGFLYLIGWSIGLLADEEKQARRKTEDLVAELRSAARILEQAQKMALIGRLAAGIAHEINNPATVILIKLERMLLEAEEKGHAAELKRDLETLQKHGRRVTDVVQKLLTYSRMEETGFSVLDINAVIRQSIPLIEHRLGDRLLSLSLNLPHHLPRVYGNANRLEEVFMNLLTNAIDASQRGGQIRITSAFSGGPDTGVQVFVSDEGDGIPPENLDRIFEPFFTTKPPGQGTGLGLYVTYQILADHRASISVESPPGKGTTVCITFPLLKETFPLQPAG